ACGGGGGRRGLDGSRSRRRRVGRATPRGVRNRVSRGRLRDLRRGRLLLLGSLVTHHSLSPLSGHSLSFRPWPNCLPGARPALREIPSLRPFGSHPSGHASTRPSSAAWVNRCLRL